MKTNMKVYIICTPTSCYYLVHIYTSRKNKTLAYLFWSIFCYEYDFKCITGLKI